MKHYLSRLNDVAGEFNAWLVVAAIGLGALDGSALVALHGPDILRSLVATSLGPGATPEPGSYWWPPYGNITPASAQAFGPGIR
jgi:hypothetical protein